jgi:predicted TPR repeat methyltransferase
MVSKSKELGIDAESISLCELEGKYDVITAVFDMLNYLTPEELKTFLACVKEHLNEGGLFLCDINTLYGFENVAVGSFIVDDDERFLTVDSDFEEDEYSAEFTLFEKENALYKKSQETIKQYYHSVEELVNYSGLSLIANDDVNLYDFDEADKCFVVLGKM